MFKRKPKARPEVYETYAAERYAKAKERLARLQYEAQVQPNPYLLKLIREAQIDVGLWEGRMKEPTDA